MVSLRKTFVSITQNYRKRSEEESADSDESQPRKPEDAHDVTRYATKSTLPAKNKQKPGMKVVQPAWPRESPDWVGIARFLKKDQTPRGCKASEHAWALSSQGFFWDTTLSWRETKKESEFSQSPGGRARRRRMTRASVGVGRGNTHMSIGQILVTESRTLWEARPDSELGRRRSKLAILEELMRRKGEGSGGGRLTASGRYGLIDSLMDDEFHSELVRFSGNKIFIKQHVAEALKAANKSAKHRDDNRKRSFQLSLQQEKLARQQIVFTQQQEHMERQNAEQQGVMQRQIEELQVELQELRLRHEDLLSKHDCALAKLRMLQRSIHDKVQTHPVHTTMRQRPEPSTPRSKTPRRTPDCSARNIAAGASLYCLQELFSALGFHRIGLRSTIQIGMT